MILDCGNSLEAETWPFSPWGVVLPDCAQRAGIFYSHSVHSFILNLPSAILQNNFWE